jgi:hypothetical protein
MWLEEDGQVINSNNNGFEQPSDEDVQWNILLICRMDIDKEYAVKQMLNKEYAKSAADEEEQTSPSPECQDR